MQALAWVEAGRWLVAESVPGLAVPYFTRVGRVDETRAATARRGRAVCYGRGATPGPTQIVVRR